MPKPIVPQVLTGTDGQVVGSFTRAGYATVHLHGWILNNSDEEAGHVLSFYIPTPATPGNAQNNLPSASGLHVFDIDTAESGNAFFWDHGGIMFKDGLFVVCDSADLTGVVLYS